MSVQGHLFHRDAIHLSEREQRDGWCTPPWIWRPILAACELDAFAVDVASNAWSRVPAREAFTAKRSAFDHPWPTAGVAWMNPPYSQALCDAFFAKAYRWTRDASCRTVFGVVPLATETHRWRDHGPDHAIAVGRVAFEPPPMVSDGNTPNNREHAIVAWSSPGELVDGLALAYSRELARAVYVARRSIY